MYIYACTHVRWTCPWHIPLGIPFHALVLVWLTVLLLLQHAADERIRLEELRQKVKLSFLVWIFASVDLHYKVASYRTSWILRCYLEKWRQLHIWMLSKSWYVCVLCYLRFFMVLTVVQCSIPISGSFGLSILLPNLDDRYCQRLAISYCTLMLNRYRIGVGSATYMLRIQGPSQSNFYVCLENLLCYLSMKQWYKHPCYGELKSKMNWDMVVSDHSNVCLSCVRHCKNEMLNRSPCYQFISAR